MSKLRISEDISLPIEFVTQTQAILARKRVGKSYTASVQAEEMLKAGQQVLVIDYTGAWWGLRAGRDGKPDACAPGIICLPHRHDLRRRQPPCAKAQSAEYPLCLPQLRV